MNPEQHKISDAADAAEVVRVNEQFPKRSANEVRRAIKDARAEFHGSRGSTRWERLNQKLK